MYASTPWSVVKSPLTISVWYGEPRARLRAMLHLPQVDTTKYCRYAVPVAPGTVALTHRSTVVVGPAATPLYTTCTPGPTTPGAGAMLKLFPKDVGTSELNRTFAYP